MAVMSKKIDVAFLVAPEHVGRFLNRDSKLKGSEIALQRAARNNHNFRDFDSKEKINGQIFK